MQEEVENRTLTLLVGCTRFTGRTMMRAIERYLAHRRAAENDPVVRKGRQSVRALIQQGQPLAQEEMRDPDLRQFDRLARKYGVQYAVQKVEGLSPPQYRIFFQARDAGALTAVFQAYTNQKVRQASKPSVLEKLKKISVPEIEKAREARMERER